MSNLGTTREEERIRGFRERSAVSTGGRADIRFAVDAAGELYILSKSNGVIRAVVGVAAN